MRLRFLMLLLVGIAVFLAMAYYISFEALVETFTRLSLGHLMLSFVLLLLYFISRAFRWRMLLSMLKDPGLTLTLTATGMGYFVNVIFPVRLGEIARAVAVSKKSKVGFMPVFATVVVERVFDLAYLLVALGLLAAIIGGLVQAEPIKTLVLVSGIGLIVIVAILLILLKRGTFALRLFNGMVGRILPSSVQNRFTKAIESIVSGLEQSTACIKSVKFHLWTLMITLFNIYSLVVLFASTGLQLPLLAIMVGSTAVALSAIIPAPPGNIGTFELVWVGVFTVLGLGQAQAISSGIVVHVVQTTYLLVIGGIATLFLGGVREYIRRKDEEKD